MSKHRNMKINRTFNTWHKPRTEEGPPDDTHYSIARDRGTVKAEAHLAALVKPGGRMPVPPTPGRLMRERSERMIAELDATDERKAS